MIDRSFVGSWLKNPYVSFGAGAVVELLAYSFVHFVLHRWSRKTSYSSFVIGFVIVASLVVPIQTLMIKNSRGKSMKLDRSMIFIFSFRTIYSDVYR